MNKRSKTVTIARRRVLINTAYGLVAMAAGGMATALATRKSFAQDEPDMRPRMCTEQECGYVYDPAFGVPEDDIPPGIPFEDLPDNWECPECGNPKSRW
jgi:rubredoxin